jgi:hypothetical protein
VSAARDRTYEQGALDAAEAIAGIPPTGYGQRVLDRLDRVGAKHGDQFADMAIDELLEEIAQEALDTGGWALLTAQKAMLDGIPERVSGPLRVKLLEIAAAGAQAEKLVNEARALVGAV